MSNLKIAENFETQLNHLRQDFATEKENFEIDQLYFQKQIINQLITFYNKDQNTNLKLVQLNLPYPETIEIHDNTIKLIIDLESEIPLKTQFKNGLQNSNLKIPNNF